MKNMDLLIRIPDGIISRKELMQLVIEVQPEFREGQMKRLIEYWIRMSEIERVGRDKYKKCTSGEHLKKYTNIYTDRSKKIIDEMEQKFPLVDYRIWELRWLNEFFNHQVGYNYIFLEVEHTGCEFVFDQLIVENKKILFKPSVEDVLRYATYETILLDRLVSESPKGESSAYGLSLEKLVVDLFHQFCTWKTYFPRPVDNQKMKASASIFYWQTNQLPAFPVKDHTPNFYTDDSIIRNH